MAPGDDAGAGDVMARVGWAQQQMLAQALGDVRRLVTAHAGIQARCLECGGLGPIAATGEDRTLLATVLARFGL